MEHLFIINPQAGKPGGLRALEGAIRALPATWQIAYTAKAGDGERYARQAARQGRAVRIYACGGDGTLNEVVNGAAGYPNAAVTNVPMGTGNDFLRIFGKGSRERFRDLTALSQGVQAEMDLMECNGRLGLDVVCAGVDARIAEQAHRFKRLPLVRGMGAYVLSLLVNVLGRPLSRPMEVEMGAVSYTGPVTLVCVCNGRYYGGGFMPVGDNRPDDGLLEALMVGKVSHATFFFLVGKYATGRYRDYPQLIKSYQGRQVRLASADHRPLVVCVDGEVLRTQACTIRLSERTVNFFYPADLDYRPAMEGEAAGKMAQGQALRR